MSASTIVETPRRELAAIVLPWRRHLPVGAAMLAASVLIATLVTWLIAPRYVAIATMAYDPQASAIHGGGPLPMTDAQRDSGLDAAFASVASLPVAERVAQGLDPAMDPLLARDVARVEANSDRPLRRDEAVAAALLRHVKASRLGQSAVFTIAFTAGTADAAARIANRFAAAYLADSQARKVAVADRGAHALDTRIAGLRAGLTAADDRLAAFRLSHGLLQAPESVALEGEVSGLRGQLGVASGEAALAGSRSTSPAVVGGGGGGSVDTAPVSTLTTERADAAANLAALLGRYGERHPEIIAARGKLTALDAALANAMRGNRGSATAEARATSAREAALAASVHQSEDRLAASLRAEAERLDLESDAGGLRQAYLDLLKLRADRIADSALVQPDAEQIGFAVPPQQPLFPRLGLDLALGAGLGLIGALAVAWLRESWLHQLGGVEDVARWLGVDYFAPLPEIAENPATAVRRDPRSPIAARYRNLALAALHAAGMPTGGAGRTLGLVSAQPGEGKTATASAMATALSAAGWRVALVGATPVAPAEPGEGAGPAILGLPALPARERAEWIAALRDSHELLIIDLPALLASDEALELLSALDTLVLLAAWRRTPVREVRAAMHRVATAGGRIRGVVLTRVGR